MIQLSCFATHTCRSPCYREDLDAEEQNAGENPGSAPAVQAEAAAKLVKQKG